jgi:uncharacterized protein YxjI
MSHNAAKQFAKDFPAGKYTMLETGLTLSGDDFTIQDEHDETVLESNAALFSFGDSFTISDAHTHEDLFTLKKTIFAIHTEWTLQPGSGGEVLYTIQKNIITMHDTICVYEGENTDAEPVMTVDADFFTGWTRTFYEGSSSEVIAVGEEDQCNFNPCTGNKYCLDIHEGTSPIFVIAVMLVVDELKEDRGEEDDQNII